MRSKGGNSLARVGLVTGDFRSGRQLSKEIVLVEFAQDKALGGGKPAKAGEGSRCPELRRPSEGVGAAGVRQMHTMFLCLLPGFPEQLPACFCLEMKVPRTSSWGHHIYNPYG